MSAFIIIRVDTNPDTGDPMVLANTTMSQDCTEKEWAEACSLSKELHKVVIERDKVRIKMRPKIIPATVLPMPINGKNKGR